MSPRPWADKALATLRTLPFPFSPTHNMASSMERSEDGGEYEKQCQQYEDSAARYSRWNNEQRGRSASESDISQREIIIRGGINDARDSTDNRVFLSRDSVGASWFNTAVFDSRFAPANKHARKIFASRMTRMGFGDTRAFASNLDFLTSVSSLVLVEEVDFILESNTWDFLMAAWMKELHPMDGGYSYELGVHLREDAIKRRTHLTQEGMRSQHLVPYKREQTGSFI